MSDATFRVYDWGRVGPDGKPRELHLEPGDGVDRLRRGPGRPDRRPAASRSTGRRRASGWRGRRTSPSSGCDSGSRPTVGRPDRFTILMGLEGACRGRPRTGDRSRSTSARRCSCPRPSASVEIVPRRRGGRPDLRRPLSAGHERIGEATSASADGRMAWPKTDRVADRAILATPMARPSARRPPSGWRSTPKKLIIAAVGLFAAPARLVAAGPRLPGLGRRDAGRPAGELGPPRADGRPGSWTTGVRLTSIG